MNFLYFLEDLRTPVVTAFMSLITYCGSEIFFIAVAVTVFWCFSKRDGYYIMLVGFLGSTLNQFLKLWFRIPRPWVLDPDFSVVENARAGAGGYSFPSGHTQNIVGTAACVIWITKNSYVRIAAAALMILVPFSRMYLGCHTPLDVGVSFVTALFLAAAVRPVMLRSETNPRFLWIAILIAAAAAVLYWAFVSFYPFPADIDTKNLAGGIKNSYKLLGCLGGLAAAKALDDRYIHFKTEAVWWAQILKTCLGLFFILGIMAGSKSFLQSFLPVYAAVIVRYSLTVFFAGAVWPLTFPWFAGLKKRS